MIDLLILALVLLIVLAIIANHIRVIPEYQRLVILRLGRVRRIAGPGLVVLVPLIDKGIVVDLREQ